MVVEQQQTSSTMKRPSWKWLLPLLCCGTGVTLMVCYHLWADRVQQNTSILPVIKGLNTVPATSFAELLTMKPFAAIVEQRKTGTWRAVVEVSNGKTASAAQPTEYVMVYFRKRDGTRIVLLAEHPDQHQIDFVLHLRDGQEYALPNALVEWSVEHGRRDRKK